MGNSCNKDFEAPSEACEAFSMKDKRGDGVDKVDEVNDGENVDEVNDGKNVDKVDEVNVGENVESGSRRHSKVTFRIDERCQWKQILNFVPFLQRDREDVSIKPYPVDVDNVERIRNALFLPLFPYKRKNKENVCLSKTVLAKGRFGKVVRGKIGSIQVAVKVISKRKVLQENLISQIAQEVKIQTITGHHSFILELVGCWQTEKSLYIATVFSKGGNLEDLWKSRSWFPLASVRLGIAQLGLGLGFLHQAGIIYRDLKMANILLDTEGNLQIADFGLSRWLSLGQTTSTICGTLAFMAPEVLGGCKYSHASDWYSLGVLMFCLLKMEYPVPPAKEHIQMLSRVEATTLEWRNSPEDELVSRLMEKDPGRRLSSLRNFQQASFFRGLSFDVVNAKMGKSFYQFLDQPEEELTGLDDQWENF